jgi:hypothetical protein
VSPALPQDLRCTLSCLFQSLRCRSHWLDIIAHINNCGLLSAKILGSQREDSTPLSRHDNLSSCESHLVLRKSTTPETLVREFCTADWLRMSVVLDDHDLHIQTSESTPLKLSQGGNTADVTCFGVQGTDWKYP